MTKILFYMTRFPGVGGIEQVTSIIIKELLRREFNISILTHMSQLANAEFDAFSHLILRMPNNKKWCAKENYLFTEAIIRKGNFDYIIYQDSYAPTEKIVCSLALKYNVPLYVFEHSSPLFIYNKRNLDSICSFKGFLRRILHPYLLWKEKKRKLYLLNSCSKYVLLSKQYIKPFLNLLDLKVSDKLLYINNPIYFNSNIDGIKKEKIVLFVGRLTKSKGLYSMINAWSELSRKLIDWMFIIVGDGEDRPSLENLVRKKRIPNIKFEGFQDPTKYYMKAKIFWMMSKFEGWPMTLIESMQLGCVPIVYESFSAVNDIIDDGINGYLVPYKNTKRFISRTKSLIDDADEWQSKSENARQKVKQFDVQKIADTWVKLLF